MWDIWMLLLCLNDFKFCYIGRLFWEFGCWYGFVYKLYSRFIVFFCGGYIDIVVFGEIGIVFICFGEEVYFCLVVKCLENLFIQLGEILLCSVFWLDNLL